MLQQIIKYKLVVLAATSILIIGLFAVLTDNSQKEEQSAKKLSARERKLVEWARGRKPASEEDGKSAVDKEQEPSSPTSANNKVGGRAPGNVSPGGQQSTPTTSTTPGSNNNQPGVTQPGATGPQSGGVVKDPPKKNVKQNEPLAVPGLAWKVRSVKTADKLSFYDNNDVEVAKGKFLIVDLEVKTSGENEYFIDTEWIEAIAPNKQYYRTNSEIERWLEVFQDKRSLYNAQVAPGMVATGHVVFDIPKDLKTVDLAFYSMDDSYEGYSTITINF